MRILLVAPCFPPMQAVASLRTHAFADTWAKAGHEVTVLTTRKRPDQIGLDLSCSGFEVVEIAYKIPKIFESLRGQHRANQATAAPDRRRDDAVARSNPTAGRRWALFPMLKRLHQRSGIFSAVRMPDLTAYWVKPALAWAHAANRTWDIVVSSSGPYTAHRAARQLKTRGLAKHWVADFRDLWTQHHLYRGLFPFTLWERFEERGFLREADLLVTVTDGLAEKLSRQADRPVEIIYNGYDSESSLSPEPAFPADGLVRLVYTGTLYPEGQDPTPLFRAWAEARTRLERLRLVVVGPSGSLFRELARRHKAEDFLEDHGPVPRDLALRMQRDAAGLLLLDWNDPSQGVLTGKVFEYLRADPPILLMSPAKDSSLIRLIKRAERGVLLGPQLDDILPKLEAILEGQFGCPGNRDFLATLSRSQQSLRLLERMQQLPPTLSINTRWKTSPIEKIELPGKDWGRS